MRMSGARRLGAAIALAATAAQCAARPAPARVDAKGGAGELRVLTPASPTTLNPDLRNDELSVVVGRNVFNQLVALDSDGEILPDLAQRWEIAPDGLTYTFHLAPGVRWHDGAPCTSADVKWTFETIAQ